MFLFQNVVNSVDAANVVVVVVVLPDPDVLLGFAGKQGSVSPLRGRKGPDTSAVAAASAARQRTQVFHLDKVALSFPVLLRL